MRSGIYCRNWVTVDTDHKVILAKQMFGYPWSCGSDAVFCVLFWRQHSQAMIKIADAEEGSKDRKVIITGSPASISAATYLINTIRAKYESVPTRVWRATGGSTVQRSRRLLRLRRAAKVLRWRRIQVIGGNHVHLFANCFLQFWVIFQI